MTTTEIYDAALRMVGEVSDVGLNEDYKSRADYLLPAACAKSAGADRAFRLAHGLEPQTLPEGMCYEPGEVFPLSAVFATAVAAELASLLVLGESPAMSDRLHQRSQEAEEEILRSLPFRRESIVSVYGDTQL